MKRSKVWYAVTRGFYKVFYQIMSTEIIGCFFKFWLLSHNKNENFNITHNLSLWNAGFSGKKTLLCDQNFKQNWKTSEYRKWISQYFFLSFFLLKFESMEKISQFMTWIQNWRYPSHNSNKTKLLSEIEKFIHKVFSIRVNCDFQFRNV